MREDFAVLIFSSSINIIISLLVLYRNYKKPANLAFAITCLSLGVWSALNFLSTFVPHDSTLIVTRLTGLFGALLIASFYMLSQVFPNSLPLKRKRMIIFVAITATVCALSLTSLFIRSGVNTGSGLALKEGSLYPLYPLYILVVFILCNVNFIRQYRQSRKYAKSQIKMMWLGIFSTVFLIVLSNIIIPALTSSWSSSKFGTIFTLPFVGFTAYAILRQRMFDVRLVISRTVAYILTIGFVAALYSLIVIVIITHVVSFGQLTPTQLVALIVPALFIALTFHKIQLIIDTVTQSVFYRDAYDPRDVLDSLSNVLVGESDIDEMMAESLAVLTDALKSDGAYLAVLNASGIVYKQLHVGEQHVVDLAPYLLRLKKDQDALIDVNESANHATVRVMNASKVELLLRLGSKDAPLGVLLLGGKRNGSMYTDQDIAVLKICAKNLGIGLDNAKKYEQITHFADTLHKEVTRATSKLRKANDELKTLDALKDDFISTASHQLRSPAVSVHDALHMLNYPNVTKKDREELLVLAEGSSERLVTVVRTMLNMARLQAGHFTIDTSEADMVELVKNELSQVKVLADQKFITLKLSLPEHPIVTRMDVAKVNEAVTNYIENAIKYSLEKTTISITLTLTGGRICFEVADQGMGVPKQERDQLFGRFYRASNARVEQPDGNGIGLYVVKMIAEGHGGEAYYRPGDVSGSVFGFWIALEQPS